METLELLAELSVGLLGFSGVVSALGRSKLDVKIREFRVMALLGYSSTALIAALVPLLIANYNVATNVLWMVSGLFLFVLMPVFPVVTVAKYSSTLNSDPFLRRVGPPIVIVLFLVWLYLGYGILVGHEMLGAIYTLGVTYLLVMAVFHFCMLVSSVRFEGDT